MALRGDLVGEAYVRITADTKEMRRAIEREGAEGGEAYLNEFTKRVELISKQRLRRVQTAIAAGISDPKEFDRLAKSFKNPTEAAQHFTAVIDDLRRANRLSYNDQRRYTTAIKEWRDAAIKANVAALDAVRLREQEIEAARIQNKQLTNFFRLQNDGLRRLTIAQNQQAKAAAKQAAAAAKAADDLNLHSSRVVTFARNSRVAIDKVTYRTDRMGEIVGRVFGKGSRNNFLNWTGSMIGGLTRLGAAVFTFPLKALSHIGDSFGTAFSAARAANLGKMASAGRGLLAIFGGKGGLIGLVVGLGAAGFTLGKILPGVISLMTMLGGAVSALVGSISIGLTGALLAVVPAAAGAAAGLGGLFSVFTGFFMDDANKKFVENFMKPWKDMNKSYYPEVRTFLTNIRSGFDDLITDIRPSIDAFFTSWQEKMQDPTTRDALSSWSDSLGRIATSLSQAGTSFLSGLVGFFEPVLPYAEKLANYIERVAATFDKWANSPEGQNSIAVFMEKAWIAADKVWRILGNIGGIIGDVFMGGNETGTSFLDGILTKLQEINDYLDTPEGQAAMERFFGDVKGIGESIGTLAVDVGKMIKEFNSPEGRANAQAIMNAVVAIGDAAVKVASVADSIGNIMSALTAPLPAAILGIFGGAAASSPKNVPAPRTPFQSNPFPTSPTGPTPPAPGRNPYLNVGPTTLPPKNMNVNVTTSLNGTPMPFRGNNAVAQIMAKLGLSETQQKQLAAWVVPVTVNDTLAKSTMKIIEQFRFTGKVVPVDGNESEWNVVKGTVAGYAFDPKTVKITANADPAKAAIENVRRWLNSLPNSKTIRIAGVNSTGGIPMAAGGILTGPTHIYAGEAGREAIVPLDRPPSQVDPAVRALAAIAQGKAIPMARGGVAGGGRTINVHPGAIIVQSPFSDPAMVAESVIDRFVQFA